MPFGCIWTKDFGLETLLWTLNEAHADYLQRSWQELLSTLSSNDREWVLWGRRQRWMDGWETGITCITTYKCTDLPRWICGRVKFSAPKTKLQKPPSKSLLLHIWNRVKEWWRVISMRKFDFKSPNILKHSTFFIVITARRENISFLNGKGGKVLGRCIHRVRHLGNTNDSKCFVIECLTFLYEKKCQQMQISFIFMTWPWKCLDLQTINLFFFSFEVIHRKDSCISLLGKESQTQELEGTQDGFWITLASKG